MVRTPMCRKLEISFRSAIPFTSEVKMRGMAISFSRRIKIVPKGAIQSPTKVAPHEKLVISSPKRIPDVMPMMICQCRGSRFLLI